MSGPSDRYRELVGRVDAFFARVRARHPGELACASGCDSCCHVRPGVTGVEADVVRAFLSALAPPDRDRLVARARGARGDRCAALDEAGRCAIYAARPLVCRSHGLPIRTRDARSLPVVSSCHLNFVARGPAAADADCILDQETLSTVLFAIDAARAGESGAAAGGREDLAAVIRDAGAR
ncbi:MAG TPA: YkgJ family cysteine cluster protein [Polyangiaceae bacterium]